MWLGTYFNSESETDFIASFTSLHLDQGSPPLHIYRFFVFKICSVFCLVKWDFILKNCNRLNGANSVPRFSTLLSITFIFN
jgi:hypothetical protein